MSRQILSTFIVSLAAIGCCIADEVRLNENISYAATDNPRQQLDLLLPKDRSKAKKLPVVVFIHGGAWRNGKKEGGRNQLKPFVNSGRYAGVTIGYRLSQEAKWPAQIHDCKAAIRWVRAHADEYGLDADKIGVWGTSAGGHLVAMLGVSQGVESLEGNLGNHLDKSSEVTCVANYFGPSALLKMDDFPSRIVHNAPDSPESQLVGGPIQTHQEAAKHASPLSHVTSDDAPFLHVHGDKDLLVPYNQSVILDQALDAAKVPSLLITMKDQGHGGFKGTQHKEILRRFFALHLLGEKTELTEVTLSAPTP